MDPLSAFSLVCGIIQVIGSSIEVAKKCRDLYKDGVLSENAEVEQMAKHLSDLRTNLDLTKRDDPDELSELGSNCSDTAQELIVELQKLKVNEPNRKRKVVGMALKIILRKGAIEDIRKRLEDYQKVLDSRILVDLSNRSQSLALQQSEKFQYLDLKIQAIIIELAKGPRSFDALSTLIKLENSSIKQFITKEFRQHQENLAREDYCRRFIKNLWYPEIYSRQERVSEAHQKTFQWIYEPDSFKNSARQWYNIVHWLEKDRGIYWISGKAGSGKSTLMNFIHQDNRTSALLGLWAGRKKVLTPGFFFWNAGTTLERSYQGLLRSLLYQILQKVPDLIPISNDPILSEGQSAASPESDRIQNDDPFAAWTERRLRTTFQSVMRQAKGNCHICIFIDGLDEISGDPDAVIAAVENMQSADVKICLSSRPDRSYLEAFRSCAMLRLQDLTEPDIRTYVLDKLHPFLPTELPFELSYIMDNLVDKAQGVFLWVVLVVKALIKGLKDKDSLKQLHIRVESLPSEIEALYANMLSKIDVAHRRDAARLFQMALAGLTGSILDVTLALHDVYEKKPDTSIQEILSYCRLTQERIPTICAGLLEIHLEDNDSEKGGGDIASLDGYLSLPIRYTSSQEAAKVSFQERYAHVEFIHRTAADFLRQSKQGRHFLDTNSQACPSPYTSHVKALLAKVKLLGLPEKPVRTSSDDFVDTFTGAFINRIMCTISSDEWENGPAQAVLCEDVDRTLTTLYQRHQDTSPLSHWSTRWSWRRWGRQDLYGPIKWISTSSKSSSLDSFHSARSEPQLIVDRPLDFLGHAASYGLSCYVFKNLDMPPKHPNKEHFTYLLSCSVLALFEPFRWSCSDKILPKQFDLVAELLRRGGNPNVYIEKYSFTVWRWLLHNICCRIYARKSIVVIAKTFVDNGADVHIKCKYEIPVVFHENQGMYFGFEMSALYIVRTLLEYVPELTSELKILEETILAKGGRETCTYTHVRLFKDGCPPRKILGKERDALGAALTKARHGYVAALDESIPSPTRQNWARQLGETYMEVSNRYGDFASRIFSDEELVSSTDAEEESQDSVTTQITAEFQERQLVDE